MRKSLIALSLMSSLLLFNQPIYADDVSDIEHILESIAEYTSGTEEYTQLMKQLDQDQMDMLIQQFGYGGLLNDDAAMKERKWSPDTWDDALQGLSGGNSDRYDELVDEYKTAHPYLSQEDMSKGASTAYTEDYQQQVDTNRAAMSHASYSFEDVNKHLDNIKELTGKIDAQTNPRSLQEIDARINAEVAYLQVEQIKSMSILNEQIAQQQASELVHEKEASQFNQIPDK
jgi:type IV secretion system protein VirB5